MTVTHDLDARGLLCPLPVLKARKRLQPLGVGDVLRVLTDDPMAVIDMPNYCREAGHELLIERASDDGSHYFEIRKGG